MHDITWTLPLARPGDGSSAGRELTLAVDHGDLGAEDAEQTAVIVEG